jgi:hypothetical protein
MVTWYARMKIRLTRLTSVPSARLRGTKRSQGPTRARFEARQTASRWQFPADSRQGRVWATPGEVGRSRREAAALPGFDAQLRRRSEPRRRHVTPRRFLRSLEGGSLLNGPHCQLLAPRQSGVARKGDAAGSSRRSRRQALAALAATCFQHLAPSGRRHADTKPVRLAPVFLLGLVRPLDGRLPETLIASGALKAPLSPTGLPGEYTKAAGPDPSDGVERPSPGDALAPLVSGAAHC